MENRKRNLKTAVDRGSLKRHEITMSKMSMTGTRKLPSGDTAGNKKTMNLGKISAEPTYCHQLHTSPNWTARRRGWNSDKREGSPEGRVMLY